VNGYNFTPREVEIVLLLARGAQNKVIAHELGIAEGTVKVHLLHIYRKVGVQSRMGLFVAMARTV
jgi:Response regulator containing a CheY-like receiver domain and an HTH DNA-binding domain